MKQAITRPSLATTGVGHVTRRSAAAALAAGWAVVLLAVAGPALPVAVRAQPAVAPAARRSPGPAELRRAVAAESALVWRVYRDIHEHPELGKAERRTHDMLKRELTSLGITEFVDSKLAPTAVIAVLETGRPGPVIALRAEMDARPTQEPAGHDPRSTVDGVMHNCGHDAHAAMLLGTAALLRHNMEWISGRVVFVFQPAEETRGGADEIVAEGILERLGVSAIFAQHAVSGMPVGTVNVAAGPTMAGSAYFTLRITGDGSHAAQPSAGDDVLLAAAAIVGELAALPARRIDILSRPAVISPTSFVAGSDAATNVLPGEAVVKGTIRAFEPAEPTEPADTGKGGEPSSIGAVMRRYLDGASAAMGVGYELTIRQGSPPTVNDDRLFARLSAPLAAAWGPGFDTTPYRGMFSEDFAFYTDRLPSLYFGLGIARDGLGVGGVHSPDFTIHPAALVEGVRLLGTVALAASGDGLAGVGSR